MASSGEQCLDLESQQNVAPLISCSTGNNTINAAARNVCGWGWLRAIVKVRNVLCSLISSIANKKGNQRVGLSSLVPLLPYTDSLPSAAANTRTGPAESEVPTGRTERPAPAIPQVTQDHAVHLGNIIVGAEGTNTNTAATTTTASDDSKRQHANIVKIVKTKDLNSLNEFGGIKGIAEALNSNLETGLVLPGDKQELLIPAPQATQAAPSSSFVGLLIHHCNDCTNLLLFIAAALSIGFQMKQEGPKTGWHEGVIIMVAIVILVVAPAVRDHPCLKRLLKPKKPIMISQKVDVLRGHRRRKVSFSDVVLGDVVFLERGCLVPADGLFVDGEFLVVHDGLEATVDGEAPFLFHGFKVTHGSGRMLVTSVGADTAFSELMREAAPAAGGASFKAAAPLPAQLDRLRRVTQIVGLLISILILVVLFLRFMIHRNGDTGKFDLPALNGKSTASKDIMDDIEKFVMKPSGKICNNITSSLVVLLVGIVEGIPFVIMFGSVYLRKSMLSCKLRDPGLLACVTMGSATTICTDKTPLTPTAVAMCFVGGEEEAIETGFSAAMDTSVREALRKGISTPLIMPLSPSKMTDDPLLPWAASALEMKLDIVRQSYTIVKTKGLSSNEEGSGVLMKKKSTDEEGEVTCLHWKGPATTILGKCNRYYNRIGETKDLDGDKREAFKKNIEQMESKDLKIVAFACKPQIESQEMEENDLILIGMLGLKKNTCCREIKEALNAFKDAGVKIRLVSEDDVSELKEIATAYDILPQEGLVIEGEEFRNYSREERIDKAEKIFVMGNSLPSDRLLLVQCLKEKGNVVVALGTRMNETPTLKEADLGVAMGNWSSERAKESSDIIVNDGSLSTLVTIISCGRCTYHNIQKYIQLELITNAVGTLTASITKMGLGSTPITGVQLIWANLVMTLLTGPALLMEPPRKLDDPTMRKPPVRQTEPLISNPMWRNIAIQILYQTSILVTFQFKGQALLGFIISNKQVTKAMVFNCFMLCQAVNQVNSRELEKINVFKGIHQHALFPLSMVSIVLLQVGFVEVAHILVGNERLNLAQWGICLLIATLCCPVDSTTKWVLKLVKNRHFGSTTMTHSASSDSVANLELPLMTTANSASAPS